MTLTPAFCTSTPLSLSAARPSLLSPLRRPASFSTSRKCVSTLRMSEQPEAEEEVTVSGSEILKAMRAESEETTRRDDGTRSGRNMLGVYRDVDGKSNIWAVEPQEETDTKPQIPKATILAGAAAFIIAALLVLPLLPFTNADQF